MIGRDVIAVAFAVHDRGKRVTATVASPLSGAAPLGLDPPLRPLTVVVDGMPRDVVVDENLRLADVFDLVVPGAAGRHLAGAASGGVVYPLDQTVAQARLDAGSVIAPLSADVMARLDRGAIGQRRRTAEAHPAASLASGLGVGVGAVSSVALPGSANGPSPDIASYLATAMDPGGSSSRADMAARMPGGPAETAPPLPPILTSSPSATRRVVLPVLAGVLAVLAALAAALSAVAAGSVDPSFIPTVHPEADLGLPTHTLALVSAGLLLITGVLVGQFRSAPAQVRHTGPLLGAAGGVVGAVAWIDSPLIAVLVAAGCAGLVAIAARPEAPDAPALGRVWTAYAALVATITLAVLVVGGSGYAVACLLVAVVALAPQVVPASVVDVDDVVLLDIARLSVTSWSPRERRPTTRGRWRIDNTAVQGLVARATTVQSAALLGLVGLSLVCSAAVGAHQWREPNVASSLLLAGAVAAPALSARSFRQVRDRALLRLAAVPPLFAGVLPWLLHAEFLQALTVALLAVILGLVIAYAVRPIAAGRRSLAAGRAADFAQSLAATAALPLALWASGALDWARGLLS